MERNHTIDSPAKASLRFWCVFDPINLMVEYLEIGCHWKFNDLTTEDCFLTFKRDDPLLK